MIECGDMKPSCSAKSAMLETEERGGNLRPRPSRFIALSKKSHLACLLMLMCLAFTIQACDHVTGLIDKVTGPATRDAIPRFEDAINKLLNQSSDWQTVLKDLERQLTKDVQTTLANEVTQLAQKGIATGGVEIRCNVDFVRTRMKQDLERIVARLRSQPIPPVKPGLCQVVPEGIDMGHPPAQLAYYGYDLDSTGPEGIHVVLKHDGGEDSLDQWMATPTHYLRTLSIQAPPLCSKNNRKIIMRFGPQEVSSVNVLVKQCPGAPPAPVHGPGDERSFPLIIENKGGNIGGISENLVYGGPCSAGYERLQVQVTKRSGGGSCYGSEGETDPRTGVPLGWVDKNNKHDCQARVHFGAPPFQPINCDIQIREIKELPPPQAAPPCDCW